MAENLYLVNETSDIEIEIIGKAKEWLNNNALNFWLIGRRGF